jgi:hypothetical protein
VSGIGLGSGTPTHGGVQRRWDVLWEVGPRPLRAGGVFRSVTCPGGIMTKWSAVLEFRAIECWSRRKDDEDRELSLIPGRSCEKRTKVAEEREASVM